MMDRSAVLGIDLGTSGLKCVLAREGTILASATESSETSRPFPGWSEQDPDNWTRVAADAIGRVMAASGFAKEQIAGIGLSGQMHGAVLLNADHRPLRPAILWNDNRAVTECGELSEALPDIGQIAGIGPLPGFTAPKVMWMRRHEPALFAQIETVLLPKDYLGLWLTGNIGTDRSDAAGTLWLDQRSRDWSVAAVSASGIDMGFLPCLRDGFEQAGALRASVAEQLGLASGTPVFAGGGDAATGALALGAAVAGRAFMSLGTSGQLLMVDEAYRPDPDKYIHAYCHTLPALWYRMAAMLNGARPLAWFATVLGGGGVPELLQRAAACDMRRVPVFLPYLTGERSPHGDPDIRGCFYGLEDATGPAEMARAVVEAVAFSMGDAMASFGPHFAADGPIPAIGGGSRGDLVLQAIADVTGHSVGRADVADGGAAMGAAILAELGTGLRSEESLAFMPALSATFEPQRNAALHARFERYRAVYAALRGLPPLTT